MTTLGVAGCNGAADGHGSPGQSGGAITVNDTALTFLGGGYTNADGTTLGAPILTRGGVGGKGGDASDTYSGAGGGAGGAGSQITVNLSGAFVADYKMKVADYGLTVNSLGQAGGAGGASDVTGFDARLGGDGGAGGAAGLVALVASGSLGVRLQAVQVGSIGGPGGNGGDASAEKNIFDDAAAGRGGIGGAAAEVSAQWLRGPITSDRFGLSILSEGGRGGVGGEGTGANTATGGQGGAGGDSGSASATLDSGTITVNLDPGLAASGYGVSVSSIGGDGGNGGDTRHAVVTSVGGDGGAGGTAGSASATILGRVNFVGLNAPTQVSGQGVLVQSNGGVGGRGADADGTLGNAGFGGKAGAGGSAMLTLGNATTQGVISTSGAFAHGALVQSVGGGGGHGGEADFNARAGDGAGGGNGGPVTINAPDASVIVSGKNSIALLAQSVGGGGGSGGDSRGIAIGLLGFAIGGNGGLGGDGGPVSLDLTKGVFGSTSTLGGAGVLVQSIGGAGGSGGSASSTGSAAFSLTIGGDAKGGGNGGNVTVANTALITSYGDHATGLQAQSVGGGGGKGGSAFTFNGSLIPVGSVAVGGLGAQGGLGGDVLVTNKAQITTYGADATGVLVQSIGGGGGSGGAAAARAVSLSPSGDVPAISVSVAVGGHGGTGNSAGTATLNNADSGLITTAGDGAIGIIAQSIGGGGGSGGDSTAASYSGAKAGGITVSVSVALGGTGGMGGTGGDVSVNNAGLVLTFGQDAYGVFAQSVGGGGGVGGVGDATASNNDAKYSFSTNISVGGSGGAGGNAGVVSLPNSGSILTFGDGADGVFAQSVGGGGGAAGGGVGTATGGNLALSLSVGGVGGAAGNGNKATVVSTGNIVTRGADADAIFVQSVGGGGGKGGKGAATAGGPTPLSNADALLKTLSGGLGIGDNEVIHYGDQILQYGQMGEAITATLHELMEIREQPQAFLSDIGTVQQLNFSLGVGGKGGAAGDGGAASATNTGSIVTFGAESTGISAQSVGGGGGSGGVATSTGSANDDGQVQFPLSVGGNGGGGGNGGPVTVVNGPHGTILVQGISAFGIFAQSIGGGGGDFSMGGTVSGSLRSLSVGVGGNGGTGGDGGIVSVTTGDGTSDSSITTTGKNAIAIIAESVGGGGGMVRTLTTDQTFDPSKLVSNPQGRFADVQGLSLNYFGGVNGITGKGGDVQVAVSGPITTSGLGAHGIVAQSIGGGGGLVVGGQIKVAQGAVAGSGGGVGGNGGGVSINLQTGAAIATQGDGAYGVLAQSIGGGGGLAGDLSNVHLYKASTSESTKSNDGNGGPVSVTLKDATVTTTGRYATPIFVQSIGGGGGLVNQDWIGSETKIQAEGTAGGSGVGGPVTISLTNSHVAASGAGAPGILAQIDGGDPTPYPIVIMIDKTSTIRGGASDPYLPGNQAVIERDDAAIRLRGGYENRINNAGLITAGSESGLAILTDTQASNTVLTNTGTIIGQIILGKGGIANSGTIVTRGVQLGRGTLTNAGLLDVAGGNGGSVATLDGNYHAVAGGALHVGADFARGTSDRLAVSGNAELDPGSSVRVDVGNWRKGSVVVLTAGGSLIQDPPAAQATNPAYLFALAAQQVGNAFLVRTVSNIVTSASALNANQQAAAASLEQAWNSDAGFAGTAALATISDGRSFGASLTSVAGTSVGGIVAAKQAASEQFANNMIDCQTQRREDVSLQEESCGWMRIIGSRTELASNNGDPGYRQDATTYQTGGQKEVSPGWFLGASLGYETNWLTGEGDNTRVTGQVGLAGLMLKRLVGPWTDSGVLDAGYGWYQSERQIQVGTVTGQANGSPGVSHAGLHLRADYLVPLGEWYAKPHVTVAAVYRHMGSYSESGFTPFNLDVKSSSNVTGGVSPMVEFGRGTSLAGVGIARGFVGVGAALYINNDWQTEAALSMAAAGVGTFKATSHLPAAVAKVNFGFQLFTYSGFEAKVMYDAHLAPGYTAQAILGRLAYVF